jgi:hypothetical protein
MALSSGIYSLIGVAAGSLATGGFQLGIAIRNERRQVRAAKRHVAVAFRDAVFVLNAMIESGTVGSRHAESLQSIRQTWDRYSDLLASSLDNSAWVDVVSAGDIVVRTTDGAADRVGNPTPIALFTNGRQVLLDGIRVLEAPLASAFEDHLAAQDAQHE